LDWLITCQVQTIISVATSVTKKISSKTLSSGDASQGDGEEEV